MHAMPCTPSFLMLNHLHNRVASTKERKCGRKVVQGCCAVKCPVARGNASDLTSASADVMLHLCLLTSTQYLVPSTLPSCRHLLCVVPPVGCRCDEHPFSSAMTKPLHIVHCAIRLHCYGASRIVYRMVMMTLRFERLMIRIRWHFGPTVQG